MEHDYLGVLCHSRIRGILILILQPSQFCLLLYQGHFFFRAFPQFRRFFNITDINNFLFPLYFGGFSIFYPYGAHIAKKYGAFRTMIVGSGVATIGHFMCETSVLGLFTVLGNVLAGGFYGVWYISGMLAIGRLVPESKQQAWSLGYFFR